MWAHSRGFIVYNQFYRVNGCSNADGCEIVQQKELRKYTLCAKGGEFLPTLASGWFMIPVLYWLKSEVVS